jgi:hypothetical protein
LECAGAESLYLQGKIFEKLCDNWLTGEGDGGIIMTSRAKAA